MAAQLEGALAPAVGGHHPLLGLEHPADRIGEPDPRHVRHEPAQLAVVRRQVMLEPGDQGARHVHRCRRDERQPIAGESRRQEGHRDDPGLAPAEPSGQLAHHRLVGVALGSAGLEHQARGLLDPGQGHQVVEQLVECQGGRSRVDPARRDHHRQVRHEIAHHLEGGGARPDDDAGPELGDRHRPLSEDLPGLDPGGQMHGVDLRGCQATEIDDAPDPGGRRGIGEVARREPVAGRKIGAGHHRMDEVVGDADAIQRPAQGRGLERVGGNELDTPPALGLERGEPSGSGAHAMPVPGQPCGQVAADIAAGTEDQHPFRHALVHGGRHPHRPPTSRPGFAPSARQPRPMAPFRTARRRCKATATN
jgi:hypothetical protein